VKESGRGRERPDIEAATRGGDWGQGMEGEGVPDEATLKQALFWTQIYSEILTFEENTLSRMQTLMAGQSIEARREIELTNIPVVVAQAERFRMRRGYWSARVLEIRSMEKSNP